MIGFRPYRLKAKDEGEKPFWISYSDLMTTLMVLFLVVMSVTILTITQELLEKQDRLIEQQKELEQTNARLINQQLELAQAKIMMDSLKKTRDIRQQAINVVTEKLDESAAKDPFKGKIRVLRDPLVVDFGEAVRFARGDFHLSHDGAAILQAFMPEILTAIDAKGSEDWFNRVVVEGFTDSDGSYLFNLDLSLKRAQSVVCTLLAPAPGEFGLSREQQKRVQDVFMVGGFSFNSARSSKEASRRVELRLDFQTVEDHLAKHGHDLPAPSVEGLSPIEIGKCRLS